VYKEQSYRWLKFEDIQGETESTIVASQDQAISTNYFKNKLFKEETESKCQLCKHVETTDYLTSTCPILAKNEYLMRHKGFAPLHYFLCKALGTDMTDKGSTHTQASVCRKMLPCCGIKQ
jgi:hypothetical protein